MSQTQKMRKKASVQFNNQAFIGKDSISYIVVLTEFESDCDSLHIREGAPVWLFSEFMNNPTLAAIKERLTLPSNDANRREDAIPIYLETSTKLLGHYNTGPVIAKDVKRHERTLTTYAETSLLLLRQKTSDAVIEKVGEKIRNLKQGSVTWQVFFRKLWELILRCGEVYNRHAQ